MKKTFKLEGLDCANCAAKIENKISKLKGVRDVTVNFMTSKLILEVEEENAKEIFLDCEKIIREMEPGVKIEEL